MRKSLWSATIAVLLISVAASPGAGVAGTGGSAPVSEMEAEMRALEAARNTSDTEGFLQLEIRDSVSDRPIANASVAVNDGSHQYLLTTDQDGLTSILTLPAPHRSLSSMSNPPSRPYATLQLEISAKGYKVKRMANVPLFSGVSQGPRVKLTPGAGAEETGLEDHPQWSGMTAPETQAGKPETSSDDEISIMETVVTQPASIKVCNDYGSNCATYPSKIETVDFQTYVVRSQEGEIYCNWNVSTHYAMARAIRSKALQMYYVDTRYHKYGYHISWTEMDGYRLGRDDSRYCSAARDAVNSTNKSYLSYSSKPIDAQMRDYTGSPSLDWSSGGVHPYLASHYDKADESLGKASQQGPGLSQYGSNEWAKGFVYNSVQYGPWYSWDILNHYYNGYAVIVTAN